MKSPEKVREKTRIQRVHGSPYGVTHDWRFWSLLEGTRYPKARERIFWYSLRAKVGVAPPTQGGSMEFYPSAVVTADPTTVGPLYTTGEVAKMLRVNQRTVQEWIRSGALTAVRYGRLLRIRQADLATFGEVLPRRTPPAGAA
jgi:excisionase family DNA binding protein